MQSNNQKRLKSMTNEEQELLESMVRSIMEKSKGQVTEEDVARALEKLSTLAGNSESIYSYEHPDYGAMVQEVPAFLRPLFNNGDVHDDLPEYDDLMAGCSKMEKDTLARAANSMIYFWLDKWHKANSDDYEEDGVWLHPLHLAILIIERFALRECLPVLLEIERQDRDFAETFFDDEDMVGMPGACIYQIAMADDLPLLADFVRERGIYTFSKAEVIAAGATLPRRDPKSLPIVQQWLCDLLNIFADDIDPEVGDVLLLEAIVHCCIHAHCEAAKPMIIRMYSKYKMPNIMIPGGVNEVRKTIKRASIGVLAEDKESAETIYWDADTSYDDADGFDDEDDDFDDDFDGDDDMDDEEFEDDEEEYEYDEDELEPQQKYCGWAYGGKAIYLPAKSLQKYTLRIELKLSEPLVWRELEVPSNISLTSLAQAILLAMGWSEDHLHQFVHKGKNFYGTSQNEPDSPFGMKSKKGSSYSIGHLLQKKGDSTVFEYDYGDSWNHVVKLKAKADYADGEKPVVRLTGGANACPPDDCGGIWRYNHLLQLMELEPNARELREFYDWMGCKWDSTFFPLKEAASAVDKMN